MRTPNWKEQELDAMFGGDGNFQDYWLDPVSWADTDPRPWTSAETVLATMRRREVDAWTPDEDVARSLQGGNGRAGCSRHALEIAPSPHGERGSGLQGITTEYAPVRAQAIARGLRVLEWERRLKK